jgi:predicted peptidase
MPTRLIIAVAATCALAAPAAAQEAPTGFLDRDVVLDSTSYGYQVYVPRAYDAATEWPVILFLHGGGERGDDGLIQTAVGLGAAVRRDASRFPAIVVFPQAPADGSWQATAADVAMAALDATLSEFSTDPARVYLTGLSMGGNGSWYLAFHHPDRFAAMVVICGFVSGGDPTRYLGIAPETADDPYAAVAGRVAAIPTWIVHGEADTVVSVDESRRMAAALEAVGADVQYTEAPGTGHNAWDLTYASDRIVGWLFEQRRQ